MRRSHFVSKRLELKDSRLVGADFKSHVKTIPTISLWLIHPNWISIYSIGNLDVKIIVKWINAKKFCSMAKGPQRFHLYLRWMPWIFGEAKEKWYGVLGGVYLDNMMSIYNTLDSLDNFQRWPHISMPNVDKMFLPFVVLGGPPHRLKSQSASHSHNWVGGIGTCMQGAKYKKKAWSRWPWVV